jgi:hypothetical protein
MTKAKLEPHIIHASPRRALAEAQLDHMPAIVRRGDPLQFQFRASHFRLRSRRTRQLLQGDGRLPDF